MLNYNFTNNIKEIGNKKMKIIEIKADLGITIQFRGNFVKPHLEITMAEVEDLSKERRKDINQRIFDELFNAIEEQLAKL